MQKKYTKKYIKEAIKYWTKRLDEAEAEIDIDKPSDYHDILGLGPDEITGLFMGALIVCNNKTGECRSLNSQEAAKLKAYTERYLAKQAEWQGLKK